MPRSNPTNAFTGAACFQVGLPHQFDWLRWMLIALITLNIFDGVFTLIWVRSGMATEANVLVRQLVLEHAPLFLAVKVSLVCLGAFLLWRRRTHPLAAVGIVGSFLAYYLLLLHHLDFASWLFGRVARI
jgi:hypothetical protein